MRTCDLHWAAGFLEGEGSFMTSRTCPHIEVAQVQREPLERLERLFGGNIYACRQDQRGPLRKPYSKWAFYGTKAAALMMTVYTLMSPRRKEQIVKALGVWRVLAVGKGGRNRMKTHCKRGHPLTPDNLYKKVGERKCITCQRTVHNFQLNERRRQP